MMSVLDLLFPVSNVKLASGTLSAKIDVASQGRSERELTFPELLTRASGADGFPPEPRYLAEFHGRLVRTFALIGVALMSIPLGVARKRAPVWPRMVLAMAILVAFDQILSTVQSLASLGRIDPVLGLWGVATVFTLGSAWLYAVTPGQGSPSPLRGVLRRFDMLFGGLAVFGRRLGGWLGIRP